ncbi:MAG: putative toxin-antitoxin system toxin component, PIN family [bacterium]
MIKNIKSKVTICRDENDNMHLDLAQQAEANFIITGDKDLLILGKFENTLIIQPGDFKKLASQYP